MNKVQARYEKRWSHTEMQRKMEKKLSTILLDLTNYNYRLKEKKEMTNAMTTWSFEDLNKLTANRFRPIDELYNIFKGRFSKEELEDRRLKLKIALRKDGVTLDKRCKSKFTESELRQMYECRTLMPKAFMKKNSELLKKSTEASLNWYLGCIRAELKGIKTGLSAYMYDLIAAWAEMDGIKVPERGSVSVRSDAKPGRRKKKGIKVIRTEAASQPKAKDTSSNSEPEPKKELPVIDPDFSDIENILAEFKETPAPDQTTDRCFEFVDPIKDTEPVEPIKSESINPNEVGFSSSAELKFGLIVGNDLKLVADTLAHVEGAEMVYRQFGLFETKRVKLLMEQFS